MASQHTHMGLRAPNPLISAFTIRPRFKTNAQPIMSRHPHKKQTSKKEKTLTTKYSTHLRICPSEILALQNLDLFLSWNHLSPPPCYLLPRQLSATKYPNPMQSLPAHSSLVGFTCQHPNPSQQQVRILLTFSTSCLGCGGSIHVRSLSNKSMIAEVPMCFIIRSTKSCFFFKKSTI